MNQQLSVLLYSQYSPNSKRFLDMIKNAPIDFAASIGLSSLCIDNTDVRERILKSKNIEIVSVPCVLIIYPDGGVEKYDGSNAFKWAEEVIQQSPEFQEVLAQEQARLQTEEQARLQAEAYAREQARLQAEAQARAQEQARLQAQQAQKQGKRGNRRRVTQQAPPPPTPSMELTSIDDLDTEDEYVEEEYNMPPPPVSVRSDAGNYDLGVEFGDPEEPNRTVHRGIKPASAHGGTRGKEDIMAAAQAMQKDRDADFESNRPPGMPVGRN